MTPTAALLLALAVPAAPAPKADKGLPKDLIDLIPADTAGVLVIDVPWATKSGIGGAIIRAIAEPEPDEELRVVVNLILDAELVVVAQFLIDKAFGDFCLLVRHKEGAAVPKALMAYAEKVGKDLAPERIGKRTVHSVKSAGLSFARIDDRTLMVVLSVGDKEQLKQTRAAAYGEREKAGPSDAMRKMLATEDPGDRAVRLYGRHPKKLGLSTWLVLAAFGAKNEVFEDCQDAVVAYQGGIKMGDAGEFELRFTAKDADAARELLKAYEGGGEEKDPFVLELRAATKAVRDGDDVVIAGKLTPAMVVRAGKRPNK